MRTVNVVIIDDQSLPENVLLDVIELRVTLQRDELGGFTMQLANHFEVPESLDSAADKKAERTFRHSDDKRFDVFKPISVKMGYVGRMVTLFVGEITMLQPAFPSSGMPTFTVTGTDILQRLRRSKPDGDTRRRSATWRTGRSLRGSRSATTCRSARGPTRPVPRTPSPSCSATWTICSSCSTWPSGTTTSAR